MRARPQPRFAWFVLGTAALALALQASGPQRASGGSPADVPAQATVTPGHIVVQGRIMFIDRNSDRSHPAAGLRIEIWDQDYRSVSPGEKLDETVTDANGFFVSQEVSNEDLDGPTNRPEGTQDVFLKLFTNNGHVRVLQAGTPTEFGWPSYDIDPVDGLARNVPDGVVGLPPLYVMENTRDVEAMWTFVNLVDGWQYLNDKTGEDPGPVLAYWSNTSTQGPFYDPDERAIYLRASDAGFASVVVQQEAYALLHNAYGTLPDAWKGCTAGPTENLTASTDPACAFIQGFATFYPLAVYTDPVFASLALRGVDLDGASAATPGWEGGDAVPGRVAGAFWDLHEGDSTAERYDTFDDTMQGIWQAMVTGKPTTMAEWWAAWRDQGGDGCAALGSLFQNTIDYNTPPQVAPIGDVALDEDTTKTFDLATYATDAECPADRLSYTLSDAGDPKAGVRLLPTSMISITPESDWFGNTDVSVDVSDGPATVPADFRVMVTSVNDCPEIDPPVKDVQIKNGEDIVLNLLPHAEDVEDQPFQLVWDVELEEQDAADVTVTGRGTTLLTFKLKPDIIERRSVRAVLVVRDRDGCESRQPVALTWLIRPNHPPWIWPDRLTREYKALVNTKIDVDLRNVANDDEDGPEPLEWFVLNADELDAQVGYIGGNRQMFQFDPEVNFAGSNLVELEVRDTTGAGATAAITLTWQTRAQYNNLPPMILRNRLLGKMAGMNSSACYALTDKAVDPDDPQLSLRWFVTDYNVNELQVDGQGTRTLCLRSRQQFEGCVLADFVVRDPKGAEDSHPVRTCWRSIKLYVPFITQPSVIWRNRQ